MILMVVLYFSIGFITALNDILAPHFKDLFHLTNTLALLVQFCFFGAYFVMSLPSGWIVSRIGYKSGIDRHLVPCVSLRTFRRGQWSGLAPGCHQSLRRRPRQA